MGKALQVSSGEIALVVFLRNIYLEEYDYICKRDPS